ncbi:MAG: type II toxin-antitoxin system VapC family toxin [Pseudomonadota bacterium]|uniref:type II toxin-antitoxin system VapC family toxin n=1 Tax=Brevundimonas aurantiaca TaxID=74316 RepID=UPI002EC92851|nr:type II toxin-antitoxin system VapC family toxin [Pseudomonadota bacterium]MED5537317.1 type II toxin-antitoxin system VapC family toxin [Pseudomonadota bacterium]
MFIDASALTAILIDEPDAGDLRVRLAARVPRSTSPMAVWETVLAVSRRRVMEIEDAEGVVEDFLRLAKIEVVAIPAEVRREAIRAHVRYGKGRHPAALNFGDCFAYACARHARSPLLYKGDDFSRTDIEAA